MGGFEAFKVDEKKEEKEKGPEKKKKFLHLLDEDQTEIKLLDLSDLKDVVVIMRKCAFEVTDKEVEDILKYSLSYGSYVNRMLIGVGLSWPASYDPEKKALIEGENNAIYMEDPAVLLAYEGRGLRSVLLKAREDAGRRNNFKYAISFLSEDLPKESIESYIKEAGSSLEKLYLKEEYQFFRTEQGILTVKKL